MLQQAMIWFEDFRLLMIGAENDEMVRTSCCSEWAVAERTQCCKLGADAVQLLDGWWSTSNHSMIKVSSKVISVDHPFVCLHVSNVAISCHQIIRLSAHGMYAACSDENSRSEILAPLPNHLYIGKHLKMRSHLVGAAFSRCCRWTECFKQLWMGKLAYQLHLSASIQYQSPSPCSMPVMFQRYLAGWSIVCHQHHHRHHWHWMHVNLYIL